MVLRVLAKVCSQKLANKLLTGRGGFIMFTKNSEQDLLRTLN